jgi:hypothetical protein
MMPESRLQAGIAAAKAGDFETARSLLTRVVQADQNSEWAWYWLGYCMTVPEQREYCFRRVLTLNPGNLDAKRELEVFTHLEAVTNAEPEPISAELPADFAETSAGVDTPAATVEAEPQPVPETSTLPRLTLPKFPRNTWIKIAAGALAGFVCLCLLCAASSLIFARDRVNAALGLGTTLPLLPSLTPTSRQLPTLPPAWTPTATSPPTLTSTPEPTSSFTFAFPTPEGAAAVDMTVGSGPVTIEAQENVVLHFHLPEPIQFQSVTSLSFHLMAASQAGASDVQLYLWNQVDDGFDVTALDWGENAVDAPGPYVSGAGDIFVEVWNLGEEAVTIDNMSFTLVVSSAEGGEATYGLAQP